MKKGLITAAIVIAFITVDSDVFSGLSQKALGLQLSKKKIEKQADEDWKATRKDIEKELRKINRELNQYIVKYDKKVQEYNAWAVASRLPQYRMEGLDQLKRAKRLKKALNNLK